ncbi:putative E3 ubiquitin-protein ligase [Thecaphora frezii]
MHAQPQSPTGTPDVPTVDPGPDSDSDPDDDSLMFYDALDNLGIATSTADHAREPQAPPLSPPPAASASSKPAWSSQRPSPWFRPAATTGAVAVATPALADFPSLSLASAVSASKARGQASPWSHYAGPSSRPFNPYPSRRQELVRRTREGVSDLNYGRSTPPKKCHTQSGGVQTLAALLDQYAREAESELPDDDGDDGPISARGASMSSLIFRDLTSSGSGLRTGRTTTAGLLAFGAGSFGGEPLRVLENMDNELGAAHMGPRIYARNPKPPQRIHSNARQSKKKARLLDAVETASAKPSTVPLVGQGALPNLPAETQDGSEGEVHEDVRESLEGLRGELIRVLAELEKAGGNGASSVDVGSLGDVFWRLLASCAAVAPDATSISREQLGVLVEILCSRPWRRLLELVDSNCDESTRTELADTLSGFLTILVSHPDVADALNRLFARSEDGGVESLVRDLVAICSRRIAAAKGARKEADPSPAGTPVSGGYRHDPLLLQCGLFLRLLWQRNERQRSVGDASLPCDRFYCVMLDTTPFVEDYVELAYHRDAPLLGRWNPCRLPFLLSLGAKARILQFENGMRMTGTTADTWRRRSAVSYKTADGDASLSLSPQLLSLSIQRPRAYRQSLELFGLLLDGAESAGDLERDLSKPLRIEFVDEDAADGGGPTREWFAAVSMGFPPSLVDKGGWFSPSADTTAAEFLGLFLGLAVLHGVKVSLPFRPPAFAFKLACAATNPDSCLDVHDLAEADADLARSLKQLLAWTPISADIDDAALDEQFESTFGLSWSVSTIRRDTGVAGEADMVDLVPGGRHRSVRWLDRRKYVSRLVRYHLVDTVRAPVEAFCRGWSTVLPSHHGADATLGGREAICHGGLAIGLWHADEIRSLVLSPAASSLGGAPSSAAKLDIASLRSYTQHIHPSDSGGIGSSSSGEGEDQAARRHGTGVVFDAFWSVWAQMSADDQRKLLAFITGSQDLPLTGARGLGMRLHLVPLDSITGLSLASTYPHQLGMNRSEQDVRSQRNAMPLPWSSTCSLTLFLPGYPDLETMRVKLYKAIEHSRGFGLR